MTPQQSLDSPDEENAARADATDPADMIRRLLFVLAILASSFLIFLVQPMVGKRILPWFGGTPSVWTMCLAFYQTTLFLGYAYAHLSIRFASRLGQLVLHTGLVAAAFVSLPVLPDEVWRAGELTNPSLAILGMLGASVALPFIALASTGPLVQAWFARAVPDRSPYPLYAVSNLGSFAALLAYPFFLEPRLPLSMTGHLWSFAFAAAAFAVLGCAFIAYRAENGRLTQVEGAPIVDPTPEAEGGRVTAANVTMWILLSGCAVLVLMAVTNSVCLDVASVPFLWVLPLATYLMTFILCFASNTNYRPLPYVILTLGAFFLTLGMHVPLTLGLPLVDESVGKELTAIIGSLYIQIPAYCALLFGSCMILHGELYRLRPSPDALTAYYLCISGGGALGGLFVGILAPVLFSDYFEIRVGLFMAVVLFIAARAFALEPPRRDALRRWPWRIATPLTVVAAIALLKPPTLDDNIVIHRSRGFFGVLQVTEYGGDSNLSRQRHLMSGSTLHGVEFLGREHRPPIPSSYYGLATGIAATFASRGDEPQNVGLIGLGIGTLSAYGRPEDSFRYYEIDPAVAHIARDSGLFSFLARSHSAVEVVVRDARLAIEAEQRRQGSQAFDLLVLDAFSSDAIPVHLLTIEAFRLYVEAIRPDGVLAVHVSNRHFDLVPLVARMGIAVGLEPLIVQTRQAPAYQSQAAEWVLLSRDPERVREIAETVRHRARRQKKLSADHFVIRRPTLDDLQDVPVWSDDYSDLLGALRSN